MIAYVVNVTESTAFDFKDGYCARGWYINEKVCIVAPAGRIGTSPSSFFVILHKLAKILCHADMLSPRPLHRLA